MKAKLQMQAGNRSKWFEKTSPDWKFRKEFPATSPMKGPLAVNSWEKMLGHPLKQK